jgi:hypothetical protein
VISLIDNFERAPSGRFFLHVFKRGELVETFEENNLIVIGSQQTHAHLLGGDVANRSVTQMSFGTGIAAPAFGNTSLTSPYTKAIDSVSYPLTNQVQFAFSLGLAGGDTSAYGMAISEFGLVTAGGVLYARKTRSAPLNFASDVSFQGTWCISF